MSLLMATYNGAPYVAQQVESILNQSWPFCRLYVRDDGSQDETPAILNHYARNHPSIIRIVPTDGSRLGVEGNFSRLLEVAEGPYFMFCDQDDVWLPEKVEVSLNCIRALEGRTPEGKPLLAYTDLRPADKDLRELDSSVWRYEKQDPESGKRINRLLVQNMVFGCTIIMNDALRRIALPIPEEAVSYDWWFALVAACMGSTDYVPQATLLYRLHGRNTVGATAWGLRYILGKMARFFDALPLALQGSQRQATALLARYGDRLAEDRRDVIEAYATLAGKGFLERRATILRYGLFKTGLIRNIGMFARA